MKRLILEELRRWKQKKNRKPLILKGVRQTGKTYILKEFGKTQFPSYHYLNFENMRNAADLFEEDYDPERILKGISFLLDRPIDVKNDLVIFDEIQECPPALTSLKYFAEQLPDLALCCAGSLIGVHLSNSSFPVGKVDLLHMHPMCFAEFLEAMGDFNSLNFLNECTVQSTIPDFVHEHLWQVFKTYLVTGGLPEVVQTFLENKKNLFEALKLVRQKQTELIYGYYADIAKHSGKVSAMHVDRVLQSIPNQLARSQDGSAKKFQFKGILPSINRYQRLANVFDWLEAAELIIKVFIVEHVEIPLKAYIQESRFKVYVFDVGILGALSDLPPKSILDYEYGTYKGYFAENFVAQEFIAKNVFNLYSWQDGRNEIEFLHLLNAEIIPIEIKSGWITRSQSLNKYAEKYHPPYRVTFSAKTLNIDLKHGYYHYPIYMAYWSPI